MAKKTETVATHLSLEQRQQIERIAKLEGFDSTSEYLRHLAQCAIDDKRRAFETLSSIFLDDESSVSFARTSHSRFFRELSEQFSIH